MVLEYLLRAWKMYKNNAMSLVIAELLSLIISGIIALIGISIIFNSIGIANLTNLSNPELVVTKIIAILPVLAELGFASIFFIIAGLVWVFLKMGIYGMASESLRGITKVETMLRVARKSGFKGIVSFIIIGIITFFLFFILIIVFNILLPIIGGIIGMVLFFLIIITFSLIFPGIIEDDFDPTRAIKESFSIAKKNYLELLGLSLLYVVISLVVFIPFIGIVIYCFVISPMIKISLVFFYKRKKI